MTKRPIYPFICLMLIFGCTPIAYKPFDIVANTKSSAPVDANALLLNPIWYSQNQSGLPTICSQCWIFGDLGENWSSATPEPKRKSGVVRPVPGPGGTNGGGGSGPGGDPGTGTGGSGGGNTFQYCTSQQITVNTNTCDAIAAAQAVGKACSNTYPPNDQHFCDRISNIDLGHVNWFPVTYEGQLKWDDYGGNWTNIADDDYNFQISRPDKALYTGANYDPDNGHNGIVVEFDSDETVDVWGSDINGDWWQKLHYNIDLYTHLKIDAAFHSNPLDHLNYNPGLAAKELMAYDNKLAEVKNEVNKRAIVIGLAGVDCEHGCYTELHPAYAMLVNYKKDLEDDRWAVFVRNWGNEGGCGCEQEPYNAYQNIIRVTLSRGDTTFAQLNNSKIRYFQNTDQQSATDQSALQPNESEWSIQPAVNGGSVLTFHLGDPSRYTTFVGEFSIQWKTASTKPVVPIVKAGTSFEVSKPVVPSKAVTNFVHFKGEDQLSKINKLDSASIQELAKRVAEVKPKFDSKLVSPKVIATVFQGTTESNKAGQNGYTKPVQPKPNDYWSRSKAKKVEVINNYLGIAKK
jgi:hypothetical protein